MLCWVHRNKKTNLLALGILDASCILIIIKLCYLLTKRNPTLGKNPFCSVMENLLNNYHCGNLVGFLSLSLSLFFFFLLMLYFIVKVIFISLFRLVMPQTTCELLLWSIFVSMKCIQVFSLYSAFDISTSCTQLKSEGINKMRPVFPNMFSSCCSNSLPSYGKPWN